ncbi:sigma 54-interacting transcriptional regulator, partial [candidate division WOR-3 bacterium]|nr:sigma 54-interacting transcriptional regulator [candidate division WOR-3 bacterium]
MDKKLKLILNNVDIGFIFVDKRGKIIKKTERANHLLRLYHTNGQKIDELGKLIPEGIWKKKVKNVEVLWKRGKYSTHLIYTNIPLKDGYILCFREERSSKMILEDLSFNYKLEEIPGISAEVRQKAKSAANSEKPILITGESGVGKEILARTIHNASRRGGRFIPLNTTSIPANLTESELFGYEPGSFTGGEKGGRPGKFELADGGTIFLDEIGDMPVRLQTKLLRVIEDKEVWRIGSDKGRKVDFRVICATHKDIKRLVERGIFREDLYYRISFIEIYLPPLRERIKYIDDFIKYFLNKHQGEGIVLSG